MGGGGGGRDIDGPDGPRWRAGAGRAVRDEDPNVKMALHYIVQQMESLTETLSSLEARVTAMEGSGGRPQWQQQQERAYLQPQPPQRVVEGAEVRWR